MNFLFLAKKKLKDIYYSLSIRNKISLSFILLFSVLLILLISFVYKVSSDILIRKAIENTLQNLILVSEKFDITFDNVQNYAKAAITNEVVQDILTEKGNKDELTSYNDYIKLQNTLDSIIQPRTLIDSMIIYDFQKNIYDSGKIQRLKYTFSPRYEDFKHSFSSASQKLWMDIHTSNYYEKESQQNICTFVAGIINKESGEPIGVLETNVNEKSIVNLYSKTKIGDSGQIFIINKDGTIVSNKNSNMIYQKVNTEPYYSWVTGNEGGRIFNINHVAYLVVSRHYERLNWIIVGIIPTKEITKDNMVLTNRILLIGAICILISVILTVLLSKSITQPIIHLKRTMEYVGDGDLEARVEVKTKDEVGALAEEFNRMIKKTAILMESVSNEQKRKREYELALLQSQINPHFLYNTLENICGLAELNRNEDVINLVSDLALFYRGILSKGSKVISIGDEIAITDRYLKILKVRYGEQLDYTIHLDKEIYKYPTIKLLLQPLVENSVYHGLRNKRGKGLIEIKGFIHEGKVNIYVIDNGAGIAPEDMERIFREDSQNYKKKSFGLKSSNDRIKLYFGPEFGLEVMSTYGESTTVKIILPTYEVWGGLND